jgi:rhomboid family GlyGly-CTERM serine protease
LFEFDRQGLMRGELWRLWTGHLVHWSALHVAGDALLLAACALLAQALTSARRLMIFLLLAAPCISLFLWLGVGDIEFYRGSSGVGNALLILALVQLAAEGQRRLFLWGIGVVLLKSWLELQGTSVLSVLPEGIVVVWQAHWFGGLLALIALPWLRRGQSTPPD